MCLFKIKDDDFIAQEEDKDLARVALNRAKNNAIGKRNVAVGYVLALVIVVVPPIIVVMSKCLAIPLLILFAVIFWLLLTAAIVLGLHFAFPKAVRRTYEEQLFELKVLTIKK